MKKKVLILIQGSGRSIYFESFALELRKRGYQVTIGSMCKAGPIQQYFSAAGFDCVGLDIPRDSLWGFYLKHIRFWKKVVQEKNIGIVFSHLQWANFVALRLASGVLKRSAIIPTRHHIDASFLFESLKRKTEDAVINLLARKQAVVSGHAKRFMLQNEWFARDSKITFIPLGYDFDLYKGLETEGAETIRKQFSCNFLLLTAARLVTTKRHNLVIDAVKILFDKGLDVKLLLLDNGPELGSLQKKVKDLGLSERIFFLGNKTNVSDYIKAADLLVQPSVEESSNQVLKEAAYYYKTAIVTKGIGDFDEYVEDKKNAFCISKDADGEDIAHIIEEVYNGRHDIKSMAAELRKDVLKRFDIRHTIDEYLKLAGEKV